MVKINRSNLPQKYKNAEMHPKLLPYLEQVALVKPTCDFFIDDRCVNSAWRRKEGGDTESFDQINTIVVHQDGEKIGAISIRREYRNGDSIDVYGVSSFRINKSRGREDETTTKDIKVALRNVKKLMVGRDYTEIADLIKKTVSSNIESIVNSGASRIQWGVANDKLSLNYALLAYEARRCGMDKVVLPADSKMFVKNQKDNDKEIAKYLEGKALQDMIENKQGYGISTYSNGACALFDFSNDSVRRYASIDELPDNVQTRLAMFKVIGEGDPHSQFGCKFAQDMYFIVSGDLQMQS